MGSRRLSIKDFKAFRKKGGHVEAFFPSKLPLINLRMNNRNHRKIVIIDGHIGYVGGFNALKSLIDNRLDPISSYSIFTSRPSSSLCSSAVSIRFPKSSFLKM